MPSIVSDDEIRRLITTPKKLDVDPLKTLSNLRKGRLRKGQRSKQKRMRLVTTAGDAMEIVLRQGRPDPLNFSAVLVYRSRAGEKLLLRRYNGKHEHTNPLSGERFDAFHVHMATEEYQKAGRNAESYARPTNRFHDLEGALLCLLEDCAFEGFERKQRELFEEPD